MSSSDSRKKVLIVDDESNVRDSLQMILSRTYAVEIADSGDKALGVLTDLAAKDQGTAVEEEEDGRMVFLVQRGERAHVRLGGLYGGQLLVGVHPLKNVQCGQNGM